MSLSRRRPLAFAFALVTSLGLAACGAPRETARSPVTSDAAAIASTVPLLGDDGPVAVGELVKQARFTVLLFFSPDCPVQKAHDARIREIVAWYRPRGVAFAVIASEEGVDVTRIRSEVARRALDMPVFQDRGALVADALGVEYTTHVVVLDPDRHVLYSGGIDSERTHVSPRAEAYLRDALDAVLAGRAVAKPRTEPLGCPLLLHD